MSQHRRLRKLVPGSFHARLVGRFVGIAALALVLQLLVFGALLFARVARIEGETGPVQDALPGLLLQVFALSCCVLLPLCFGLGTLLTFRIAGPLRRIESWLAATARGDADGPCRIRATDELQALCETVNAAVARVRADAAAGAGGAAAQGAEGRNDAGVRKAG